MRRRSSSCSSSSSAAAYCIHRLCSGALTVPSADECCEGVFDGGLTLTNRSIDKFFPTSFDLTSLCCVFCQLRCALLQRLFRLATLSMHKVAFRPFLSIVPCVSSTVRRCMYVSVCVCVCVCPFVVPPLKATIYATAGGPDPAGGGFLIRFPSASRQTSDGGTRCNGLLLARTLPCLGAKGERKVTVSLVAGLFPAKLFVTEAQVAPSTCGIG